MKKYYKFVLVFMFPMILFFIAASLNNFIPIGKMIFNIYDSSVQYPGMFEHLKYFSLFSLKGGLGFNFLGTATYYLLSPLNIIYLFFKMTDFPIFYAIIIYLKIGLSSLFMYIFLKKESNGENIWQILLAIAYSLCGFISTYYYNTMWMDGVYMLPLVLLGINKLVIENKKSFYLIALALTIIFNYYIGYMICIFSIIYFVYKVNEQNLNKEKFKQAIKSFLVISFLAGLISAIVLIPAFFALMQGKASGYGDGFTDYFALNSNIKSFFYMLTPASFQLEAQSYGPPLIYSSLFAVVLVILFFFNEQFTKKLKITVLIIIAFYFLCFAFNLFDFAWQFFQRPVWWQSRYSFTFSAFLIIIAYKSITNISTLRINTKQKIISVSVFVLLIILCTIFTLKDSNFYQTITIIFAIISIFFIIDYFLIIDNKKLYWFIIAMLIVELFLNTFNNLKKNNTNNSLEFSQKIRTIRQESIDKIKEYDNGIYRMEFANKHSSNDAMLFNYNGLTMFNSVRNQSLINFVEYYLDIKVDSHCGIYLDNFNPYLLSLFNIKYIIDYEHDYYKNIIDNNSYSAYLNPYPLSFGYIINDDIFSLELNKGEYKENLNKIINALIGEEVEIYRKISNVFVPESDLIFIKKENLDIIQIYTEDNQRGVNGTIDLLKAGTTYKIYGEAEVIDVKTFEYVMEKLSAKLLSVEEDNNYVLKGTINSEDQELLMITIPYDSGLVIKNNGKVVEPKLIMDTFIGIELSKGNNEITIEYIPQGLKSGLLISGIGVLGSILYLSKKKKV